MTDTSFEHVTATVSILSGSENARARAKTVPPTAKLTVPQEATWQTDRLSSELERNSTKVSDAGSVSHSGVGNPWKHATRPESHAQLIPSTTSALLSEPSKRNC